MTARKLPPMYSLSAIGLATFLGSALAAGYMLASNYAALGQRQMGLYALWGSIAVVVLFILMSAMWVNTLAVASLFTIAQIILVLVISNKLQGAMFATFEEMGGQYFPMWRALLVGIGATVVLVFGWIAVIVLFGIEPPAPQPTS